MPGPDVVKQYEDALSPLGRFALKWIAIPGRSAVFSSEALKHKDASGRIFPRLLQRYAPRGEPVPTSVSLISFSAGYGLARELFKVKADLEALDAYIALDSIHASLHGNVVPASSVQAFVNYAQRAKEEKCRFAISHTDVPTRGFASTTQTASRILQLVGGEGGGFTVEAFNRFDRYHPKSEHGAALVGWGADFVADTLVPFLLRSDGPATWDPDTVPTSLAEGTIGDRAVAFSLRELEQGVQEVPLGSNAGPRIAQYMAGGMRTMKGKEMKLGLRSGNWCAAACCFAERQVLKDDEKPVLPWRVSGIEMQNDAKARDLWRPVQLARTMQWIPRRGDVVVLHRGRRGSWTRHIARVLDGPGGGGRFRTIGANEGTSWRITERSLHDDRLLGFIEYPRDDRIPEISRESYEEACRLSDDLMAGRVGLEYALKRLAEDYGGTG